MHERSFFRMNGIFLKSRFLFHATVDFLAHWRAQMANHAGFPRGTLRKIFIVFFPEKSNIIAKGN